MRGAYLEFVGIAEDWQLFGAFYLGRRVAGRFLGTGINLYQLSEIDLRRPESKAGRRHTIEKK